MSRKTAPVKSKRIDWNAPNEILVGVLSHHGLHARAIGRITGISPSAVYYRNRKRGIRIKDYREGAGPVIENILSHYSVRTIKNMTMAERYKLKNDLGME